MPIPLALTHVTVWGIRPAPALDPDAEGYDYPPQVPNQLAMHVRATISQPSANRNGSSEKLQWLMSCDYLDVDGIGQITRFDYIEDETTGKWYEVESVADSPIRALDLHHLKVRMSESKGLPDAIRREGR